MNTLNRIALCSLIAVSASFTAVALPAASPAERVLPLWTCIVSDTYNSKTVSVHAADQAQAEALAIEAANLPYGGKASCTRVY